MHYFILILLISAFMIERENAKHVKRDIDLDQIINMQIIGIEKNYKKAIEPKDTNKKIEIKTPANIHKNTTEMTEVNATRFEDITEKTKVDATQLKSTNENANEKPEEKTKVNADKIKDNENSIEGIKKDINENDTNPDYQKLTNEVEELKKQIERIRKASYLQSWQIINYWSIVF